ncbi:DUF268 domain-containing protein [Geobacter argillaceus]|uniref:Uncharacterized protein DUF268 n=1 Tax=Geobacter argillaceus TaxID=345631 RepID=A0A562W8M2_9BACT|nr:DUF268 domain-containing protein [Geobacter argillaceus]TWJ26351.1 uncharacterized protein DUF268 [Geobacter argillaceus]
MLNKIKWLNWFLITQFGIDIRKIFKFTVKMPRYIMEYFRYRSMLVGKIAFFPCLHDRDEEGGATTSEYFWQDLYIAKKVHDSAPQKHVDIGSRVDGFVAHIASFREIEVFDIRSISAKIPGIIFKQANLMNPTTDMTDYCDSISCLHALEHFGLGRYGDPIDPKGYESGLLNMSKILRSGGVFYLSVPVGIERVEFNAHRIFDPNTIVRAAMKGNLKLSEFALFTTDEGLEELDISSENLSSISLKEYALGIFTFKKMDAASL